MAVLAKSTNLQTKPKLSPNLHPESESDEVLLNFKHQHHFIPSKTSTTSLTHTQPSAHSHPPHHSREPTTPIRLWAHVVERNPPTSPAQESHETQSYPRNQLTTTTTIHNRFPRSPCTHPKQASLAPQKSLRDKSPARLPSHTLTTDSFTSPDTLPPHYFSDDEQISLKHHVIPHLSSNLNSSRPVHLHYIIEAGNPQPYRLGKSKSSQKINEGQSTTGSSKTRCYLELEPRDQNLGHNPNSHPSSMSSVQSSSNTTLLKNSLSTSSAQPGHSAQPFHSSLDERKLSSPLPMPPLSTRSTFADHLPKRRACSAEPGLDHSTSPDDDSSESGPLLASPSPRTPTQAQEICDRNIHKPSATCEGQSSPQILPSRPSTSVLSSLCHPVNLPTRRRQNPHLNQTHTQLVRRSMPLGQSSPVQSSGSSPPHRTAGLGPVSDSSSSSSPGPSTSPYAQRPISSPTPSTKAKPQSSVSSLLHLSNSPVRDHNPKLPDFQPIRLFPNTEAKVPHGFRPTDIQHRPSSIPASALEHPAFSPSGPNRSSYTTGAAPEQSSGPPPGPGEKPTYSYAALIGQAIMCSRTKKICLNDIYAYIMQNYAYYRKDEAGWQNSIRHNLSLNESFIKLPRGPNEPGKGSFWAIAPGAEDQFANGGFKKKPTTTTTTTTTGPSTDVETGARRGKAGSRRRVKSSSNEDEQAQAARTVYHDSRKVHARHQPHEHGSRSISMSMSVNRTYPPTPRSYPHHPQDLMTTTIARESASAYSARSDHPRSSPSRPRLVIPQPQQPQKYSPGSAASGKRRRLVDEDEDDEMAEGPSSSPSRPSAGATKRAMLNDGFRQPGPMRDYREKIFEDARRSSTSSGGGPSRSGTRLPSLRSIDVDPSESLTLAPLRIASGPKSGGLRLSSVNELLLSTPSSTSSRSSPFRLALGSSPKIVFPPLSSYRSTWPPGPGAGEEEIDEDGEV